MNTYKNKGNKPTKTGFSEGLLEAGLRNPAVVCIGADITTSVGPDGATHQALEDIGMMRVLPNMTVLSPCAATQTRLATMAATAIAKAGITLLGDK